MLPSPKTEEETNLSTDPAIKRSVAHATVADAEGRLFIPAPRPAPASHPHPHPHRHASPPVPSSTPPPAAAAAEAPSSVVGPGPATVDTAGINAMPDVPATPAAKAPTEAGPFDPCASLAWVKSPKDLLGRSLRIEVHSTAPVQAKVVDFAVVFTLDGPRTAALEEHPGLNSGSPQLASPGLSSPRPALYRGGQAPDSPSGSGSPHCHRTSRMAGSPAASGPVAPVAPSAAQRPVRWPHGAAQQRPMSARTVTTGALAVAGRSMAESYSQLATPRPRETSYSTQRRESTAAAAAAAVSTGSVLMPGRPLAPGFPFAPSAAELGFSVRGMQATGEPSSDVAGPAFHSFDYGRPVTSQSARPGVAGGFGGSVGVRPRGPSLTATATSTGLVTAMGSLGSSGSLQPTSSMVLNLSAPVGSGSSSRGLGGAAVGGLPGPGPATAFLGAALGEAEVSAIDAWGGGAEELDRASTIADLVF